MFTPNAQHKDPQSEEAIGSRSVPRLDTNSILTVFYRRNEVIESHLKPLLAQAKLFGMRIDDQAYDISSEQAEIHKEFSTVRNDDYNRIIITDSTTLEEFQLRSSDILFSSKGHLKEFLTISALITKPAEAMVFSSLDATIKEAASGSGSIALLMELLKKVPPQKIYIVTDNLLDHYDLKEFGSTKHEAFEKIRDAFCYVGFDRNHIHEIAGSAQFEGHYRDTTSIKWILFDRHFCRYSYHQLPNTTATTLFILPSEDTRETIVRYDPTSIASIIPEVVLAQLIWETFSEYLVRHEIRKDKRLL